MQAFQFRLDQALRWRAAQRDVERSRLAIAARELSDLKNQLDKMCAELTSAAHHLGPTTSGAALESLSAFSLRTRRKINETENAVRKAEANLAAQTQVAVEADRRHRLIEKLKSSAKTKWQEEFNRELESFASDCFLGRLQSKKAGA